MAYEKHNYQSGAVLMASELNEMDDAIEALDQETTQLKEDLDERTGTQEIIADASGYIATNGQTVDINTVVTNAQFVHVVVDCTSGDRFTITGVGGTAPRVWCFVAQDGTSLSVAANGGTFDNALIVAPENTKKLVVNFAKAQNHALYKGVFGRQIATDVYPFMDAQATLYPTGDTTARQGDILATLTKYGACYFAPGDYYISSALTLPDNARLYGVGKKSHIIMTSSATGQMINVGANNQIGNLWFDGGLTDKPTDASTNRHGIRVQDNKNTLQMHDCWITGFGGSGIRVSNAGYRDLSSIQITNCHFLYCGYGILFMEHGEYGVVANCTFIDNVYGFYIQGGNNIVSGCAIERNTIGAAVDGNNIDNSGHGAFIGCSFNHNTDIGLQVIGTDNGYLISGCQLFRNTNYEFSFNAQGINVDGCNFGASTHLIFYENCVTSISGCMFASAPIAQHVTGSIVKESDNYIFNGDVTHLKLIGINNRDTDVIGHVLSDYSVINAIIDGRSKWSNVGISGNECVLIPVKSGIGVTIITKDSVNSMFGFLRSYAPPVNDETPLLSNVSGFRNVWLTAQSIKSSYITPSDVQYLYFATKVNGSDRTPLSVIIDGYDIISGQSVMPRIYAGSGGTLNTLMQKASKLICTVIDDDAQDTESMDRLDSVCTANGIKATIASLTNKWENNDAMKQKLYEMESKGHHIVLHAHTQDGNDNWQDFESRVDDYTANFVLGLRELHQAGFANCDFWVTPGGVQYDGCQKLARQYGMKALITGVNGINIVGGQTLDDDGSGALHRRDNNRWRIRRANLRAEDDTDWTLQNLKDLALNGSHHASWLILCTHSYQWNTSELYESAQQRIADFVAYAKSLGYEFMTLGEAWTYKEPAYILDDSM